MLSWHLIDVWTDLAILTVLSYFDSFQPDTIVVLGQFNNFVHFLAVLTMFINSIGCRTSRTFLFFSGRPGNGEIGIFIFLVAAILF